MYVGEHLDRVSALPAERRRGSLGVFSAEIEVGEASAGEVRDMLVVLVSAGSETTASLIATTIEVLAVDPVRQQHLRSHPEELPDAVEGILRADGPFQFHYRYVPADTELGGVRIPAGAGSLMRAAADPSGSRQSGAADGGPRAGAGAALRLRPRSALLHRRARRPSRGAPGGRAPARRDRPLRARPGASRRPTTEHLHPATRGNPLRVRAS